MQAGKGFPSNGDAAPVSVLKFALVTAKKIDSMIQEQDIENLIYNTVDIVPEGEDSVFLGDFLLLDSPACVGAILEYVTRYYDTLLQLPLNVVERLQLQTQRCFTFEEYQCLFTLSITEHRFMHYAIFKTLLITTNAERLLFIRNHNHDGSSYEGFVAFLQSWSKIHNPFLHSLLYEIYS